MSRGASLQSGYKMLKVAIAFIVITAIGVAIIAYYDSVHRYPVPPPEVAGPRILSELPYQIVDTDPAQRRLAEDRIRDLLLDPERALTGIEIDRSSSIAPATWFAGWGREHLSKALFARLRDDEDGESAALLLDGLALAYPDITNDWRVQDDWPHSMRAPSLARSLATPNASGTDYRLRRWLASDRPPSMLLAIVCLHTLGDKAHGRRAEQICRWLLRVPDALLAPLIAKLPRPILDALEQDTFISSRYGSGHGLTNLDAWLRAKNRVERRRKYVLTMLSRNDIDTKLIALERFRWDPFPNFEDKLIEVAQHDESHRVRLAATRALSGIAPSRALPILSTALGDVTLRPAAFTALKTALGTSAGGYRDQWDIGSRLEVEDRLLEDWRDRIRRGAEELTIAQLTASLTPKIDRRRIAQIEAATRRGELGAEWFERNQLKLIEVGLTNADAEIVAATYRLLLVAGELPPASLITAELKHDPAVPVRRALLDALIHPLVEADVRALLEQLIAADAADQNFTDLSAMTALSLTFPRFDLATLLATASRAGSAEERAAAAHLFAGLHPNPRYHEAGAIAVLVDLLADSDTRVRFWALASLTALYGDPGIEYDSAMPPEQASSAVEAWHAAVARILEQSRSD